MPFLRCAGIPFSARRFLFCLCCPAGSKGLFLMNEKLRKRLICLCEAAVFVALATVLNLFTYSASWTQGGSVSLTMIPLIILALRRGPLWGMAAGLVFGLIDCTMGGGFGYGLPSVLVDYLAAYALVGTAGFFRRVKGGAIIGTVVGCFLRFAAHFCSGLFIFPYVAFAWDTNTLSQNLMYSLTYNAGYMLPNLVIALAFIIPFAALKNSAGALIAPRD